VPPTVIPILSKGTASVVWIVLRFPVVCVDEVPFLVILKQSIGILSGTKTTLYLAWDSRFNDTKTKISKLGAVIFFNKLKEKLLNLLRGNTRKFMI
jgi:hypothetical protein